VNVSGTYYIKGSSAAGCTAVKPVLVSIEKKINGIRYPMLLPPPILPYSCRQEALE
jgi:hypothetical protein